MSQPNTVEQSIATAKVLPGAFVSEWLMNDNGGEFSESSFPLQ